MNITRLLIDLAKDVFQLYGVDGGQKCVPTKRITSRAKLIEFISKLKACEIYMEACGSSNDWARTFQGYGHTVKLISPQYVKPYIQRNKNDYRDAQGMMGHPFGRARLMSLQKQLNNQIFKVCCVFGPII